MQPEDLATLPSSPSTGTAGSLESADVLSPVGYSQEATVRPEAGGGGQRQPQWGGKTKSRASVNENSSGYNQGVVRG